MFSSEGGSLKLAFGSVALGGVCGALFVLLSVKSSPYLAVVLFVGIIVTAILFRYPFLAFLSACAVIPMERLGRFTEDSSMYTFSLMRVIGILALASLLLHLMMKNEKIRFGPPVYLYTIYWLLGLIAITHTTDLLGNVRASGAILGNLLFLFLIINAVRDWKLARQSLYVWLTASTLIGMYAIFDWYFGQSFAEGAIGVSDSRFSTVLSDTSEYESLDTVRRATGPTSHSAVFGMNLILTLPFFAYVWHRNKDVLIRAVVGISAAVTIYNIFLTNTRAVIILTVVVMMMLAWRKLIVVTTGRIMLLIFMGVMMLPFVPDAIYDRVLDPSNYSVEKSGTLRARLQYWSAGLEIIQEEWLIGIGPGNQQEIPKRMVGDAPAETTVHNEYLQTFIELGIIGWTIFFGFVLVILRYSFKAAATFKDHPETQDQYWFLIAAQIAMISVLIDGLQVDVFHFPLKGWWLIAGLVCALYTMSKKIPPESVSQGGRV
ncbi:MAG: O-antigen ligase family protein [Gammaproteobacteria bacterium]